MLQFKFFQPESFRTVPAVMQTSIFDGIDRLMHLMYRVSSRYKMKVFLSSISELSSERHSTQTNLKE
ncbi:hypothetical protein HI914_05720 [Erysiphe necator]|nr:hypothetical protein HI914_05720 [Erysiphe necator]